MNRLKNLISSLVSGPCLAILSLLLTGALCEIALGILAKNTVQTKCPKEINQPLYSAQSHSRQHGFYPLQKTIRHCAQDFDYSFSTDSFGLRGHGSQIEKRKILALGDSFTFGFGIPDNKTFPALLGAYNAGVFAAPFSQQVDTFKYIRAKVPADKIIWDIYPPHMITMTSSGWGSLCPGDRDINIWENTAGLPAIPISDVNRNLLNYSNTLSFIAERLHIKALAFDTTRIQIRKDCYFTKEEILYQNTPSGGNTSHSSQADKLNAQIHIELEAAYQQFKSLAQKVLQSEGDNIQNFYFVLIPSKLQLALSDTKHATLNSHLAFDKIIQILLDAHVPSANIIDLTPIFTDAKIRPSLFFESDAHWNELGHQKVAEFIETQTTTR